MARNGRLAARAVLVNGAGHQLLAGAALAQDQHGDVLRGDAADGLVDLLHGGSAPNNAVDLSSSGSSFSAKTAGTCRSRLSSIALPDTRGAGGNRPA